MGKILGLHLVYFLGYLPIYRSCREGFWQLCRSKGEVEGEDEGEG